MRIKHFFFALVAMLICSVSSVFAEDKIVAKIGGTEYATLQDAMSEANKAAGNYTITLLENSAEVFTFAQKSGVNITVDGDGNTFSGKITLNAGGGNLTFTDAKIAPANSQTIYLNASTAPNVTFDGCTLQGTNKSGTIIYGYASATSNAALKVKNCTADNLQYIVSHRQTGAKSVLVENVTASNMIYLVRTLKCPSVTVKNVTVSDAVIGIDIKNDAAGGKLTLENVNINIVTYNGSLYCPVSGSGAGKSWTVEFKGNNTFSANGVAYTDNSWFSGNAGYVIKDANVAKIGDKLYYDFATAFEAAQPGQTIVLLADYNGEPVTLAEGVKLDANNFKADGITVIAPAYTVQIGEQGYETITAALAVAQPGQTITFVADITEDVTVSKAVTIDGAGKTYTGKMTLKADATINNLNFDGKGYNGYAVETRGAQYLTIVDCTAKNYGYGFVQTASGTALTTVKNVTVSDMGYGVKVDYSNAVVLENVDITATVAAVLNSNYGEKTITIKNSKLNILGTWKRNDTTNTTYVFEGANTVAKFITEDALDNFKLAAGATLTAPEGKTVTTVEEYEVKYEDGAYKSVELPKAVMIGEVGYKTLAEALAAAQAGQTITFIADITEDVTVNKAVTIDGTGKTYTGAMTLKADVTIKNLNFDGKGYNGYAITTRGAQNLTIEACTAKNYGYGFVQLASGTALTTVKDVTVSNMNYGVKVDYSNAVVLENVDITATVAAVLNSNYGEKTITIKNSKLNILGTWKRNDTTNTTYVFEGANTVAKFITEDALDNFKLAAGATLTAPEGKTVTTDAAGYMVKYEDGVYKVVGANVKNEATGATYASIADALAAAQAGQTITFIADITEDVTVSTAVTIDGAGKTYTGKMTLKADATIKNLNFDGKGYNGYAVETRGAGKLTIEDCTAKNYGYGFVQLASGTELTTVKNVTVSDMGYGVKVDYSNAVVLENVDITAGVAAVLNSNYGEKTITIKNSKLNILGTWKRNDTTNTTYVFEGANTVAKFITEEALDNFKLAAGATLTAPEGKTVTTVDGYEVKYENGIYASVEMPKAVMIGKQGYETLAAALAAVKDGETITLFVDVESSDIITINKAITLDGNGKTLTSTAARAINVDGADGVTIKNLTINATGERAINVIQNATNVKIEEVTATADNYTVNVAASAPNAVVAINNSTLNGLCTVNVAAAGAQVTIDDSTVNCNDNNTTAGESYAALCLNKAAVGASIIATNTTVNVTEGSDSTKGRNGAEDGTVTINGSTEDVNVTVAVITYEGSDYYHGFSSLAEAVEFAKAGDVVSLIRDITASDIITINKAITLNGNGKTLTSTAGRAINIDTKDKVVINNLTVNAGERAFNIINEPATVELNGVTATASNNAVMIATSAGAANVTINGCDFTGLAVVNVAGVKSNVAIKNSTITNVDNNPDENYGAITVWSSAENAVVNVENTTITVADDSKKAYVFPASATVTGVDEVGRIIVTVGDAGFDTLAEAIDYANGKTITFVMNAEGPGVVINKNAVIDFNGCTYSFTEGVGSTGTPSNGFQILKGNNVTLKNGTLNVADEAADKFYILVQNYANLTVENMILDGTYLDKWSLTDGDSYVLSNNCGTVTVKGSTITANNDGALAFAMDACLKAPYEAPVVTVAEGSTINGNVEVSATLNMNGKLNGNIVINGTAGVVNGAAEGLNVITNVADHKVVNNNGAYTVAAKNYVAQVGEAKFESLREAVEAAEAGATVELLADVTLEGGNEKDAEAGLVIDKELILDGKEHTINCGTFVKGIRIYNPIYPNKWRATFQNVTIVNDNANGRCIDTRNGAINLSVLKSSLIATNGNSQPLTIGGSEAINSVTLSNHVTIDAGNSGYAVINFVPAKQFISTAGACEISGYAAFYCKADDTRFNLTNTKITGKNVHSGETNGFGAIVLEGNNNTVNLLSRTDAIAITEGGAEQAAILVCGNNNTITMEEKYSGKTNISAEVNTQGENAYWTMVNAEATGNSIVKYGENVELVAEANGYQFVSFEEAVRFAKNGGEIKLLSNVALDTKTLVTCGGYSSIFNVKGMELTFDLNGHTITVDADPADFANAKQNMLMGVFTVDDGGKLTIDDSSEAKNGAVNVNANGATVYSLAAEYGKDAKLTINNGSYYVNEMPNATSLIYAQHCEGVIINGGTYNIGNVGKLQNGSPWIFNTKGQNVDGIYVYGGTYPTDINHQFWFNEAIVPGDLAVKANEDSTWWSVVEAAAYTNEVGRSTSSWRRNVGYATIEEAIAATQTRNCKDNVVTLAKSVEIENTITVANGVEVTLNLNGNTISATDNATGSYALITNRGNLTIEGDGAITLKATQDRDWNAFSSVISNTVGGKLTVNGGTIEHLGGTDMAYGIDNLTNGKGTYAETIINDGEIKSTYRAIRMFLNGIEAQNILTVNGGTIEGTNKSIWMQDPSKNANTGNLYVGEKAVLNGDVYLTMTAGSTQWPVEAYIAKAALAEGKTVLSNVPADAAAALVAYDTFWQVEQKNLAELTIVDEEYAEYINKVEKTVGVLTYERNFENTEWQTLYLPFEVPVEALTAAGLEAAYIYNASYKDGAATINHVVMEEGSLAANYPYFVRATEAGVKSVVVENATLTVTDAEYDAVDCSSVFEKFTFTGTYNVVDADNLDENKGHFVKEGADWETMDEVYAFRVYLTIELRNGDAFANPQAIRMRSVDHSGKTTGVDSVDAEQAGEFIFDLQGRRVAEPEKGGIYIINGQKVLVK